MSGDPQAVDAGEIARDVASTDFKKFADGSVEICIVMDCTGSMGSWIEAAKSTSLATVHTLREKMPGAKFRLAFVGYRDFGDKEQFITLPFSEDVASVETRLRSVRASGGADTCEDMAGGFAKACDLSWSSDYVAGRDTRVLICVADAPPHGAEMHDVTVDDHHPRVDPAGRNSESMRKLVREVARKGCDLYFMKITAYTDVCIREFARVYDAARAMPTQSFVVLNLTSSNAGPAAHADELSRGLMPLSSESMSRKRSAAKGASLLPAAMGAMFGMPAAAARSEAPAPMMSSSSAPGDAYADAVTNSVLRSVRNQRTAM